MRFTSVLAWGIFTIGCIYSIFNDTAAATYITACACFVFLHGIHAYVTNPEKYSCQCSTTQPTDS